MHVLPQKESRIFDWGIFDGEKKCVVSAKSIDKTLTTLA